MARKAVERNISYDDVRQCYYVSMELGRDENGKRIKKYRTFPTLSAARNGLKDFHTQREAAGEDPGGNGSGSLARVLDGVYRPAQPGGDYGVRISKDH